MDDWQKTYFNEIQLNGAIFSVFLDSHFKKIHIFDKDEPGSRSVTNAASKEFISQLYAELINKHRILDDIETYDVFLYGTDGLACEFLPDSLGGEFKHVPPTDPHLFEPFVILCSRRWTDSYKALIGGRQHD